MGSQNQIIALCDIITQLCNDSVSVTCSGNNRVAVVTEHMGVNCIDLRYLHIKCLCGLMNDKINAADVDFSLADHVGDLVYGVIKNCSECVCEIGDKCLAAAVFGVFHSVLCGILRHIRQERCTGTMVGNQHSCNLHTVQIGCQFLDIIEKAGRFQNDCLAGFLHNENLIVDKIVGFVSVQLNSSKIVDVHFTLGKLNCGKCILIHDKFLLKVFWIVFQKNKRLISFCDSMIPHIPALEKYALFCKVVTRR